MASNDPKGSAGHQIGLLGIGFSCDRRPSLISMMRVRDLQEAPDG